MLKYSVCSLRNDEQIFNFVRNVVVILYFFITLLYF